MFKSFILFSSLWRRAAVWCLIVEGWVDHGFTDVFWSWWRPSNSSERILHHAAAFATSTYNTEAPKCYTTKAHELRYKLRCPELHHQSA